MNHGVIIVGLLTGLNLLGVTLEKNPSVFYGVPSEIVDNKHFSFTLSSSVTPPANDDTRYVARPFNSSHSVTSTALNSTEANCGTSINQLSRCMSFRISEPPEDTSQDYFVVFQHGNPEGTEVTALNLYASNLISSTKSLSWNNCSNGTGYCKFSISVSQVCSLIDEGFCDAVGDSTSTYDYADGTFYVGFSNADDGKLNGADKNTSVELMIDKSNFVKKQGPDVIVFPGDERFYLSTKGYEKIYSEGYMVFIKEVPNGEDAVFEVGNGLEYIPWSAEDSNITYYGPFKDNLTDFIIDEFKDSDGNMRPLKNLTTYVVGAYYLSPGGGVPPKPAGNNNNTIVVPNPVTGALGENRCFVATYLFGENHFVTQVLRGFRNHILLKLEVGKEVVRFYNQNHIKWIQWSVKYPFVKYFSMALIWFVVAAMISLPGIFLLAGSVAVYRRLN